MSNIKTKSKSMHFASGNDSLAKLRGELYPTPAEATLTLCTREAGKIPQHVWEPAAGLGHISGVLRQRGHTVIETDLHATEYGVGATLDFLAADVALHSAVVTNPPYSLLNNSIRTALGRLGIQYLAMFLPFVALVGVGRNELMRELGYPNRIHAFESAFFIDMGPARGFRRSMFSHAWYVWSRQDGLTNTPTLTMNDWRIHC